MPTYIGGPFIFNPVITVIMQKRVLFFMFVFFIQINLYAQKQDSSLFRGSGGYLSYGLHFMNPSSFNHSLGQYRLPAFGSTKMSVSIGGGTFLKRLYLGGQGAGQFGLSASNDLYQSRLNGGYGMVQVGYTLVHTSSAAFYPALGIGGGGSLIRIDAGSTYAENKDGLLLQPGNSIQSGYMLLDLGVNGDFFIGAEKNGSGRLFIGIAAGYQWHPLISTWRYQDQPLSGLEEFAPSGFYLKVKVGWGLFM